MEASGQSEQERRPLKVGENRHQITPTLRRKAAKSGHLPVTPDIWSSRARGVRFARAV